MAGIRSSGGLMCSHGSDLDSRIPRAKMPSRALPDCLRSKMGFKKGKEQAARRNGHSKEDADVLYRTPGAGVLIDVRM